MTSPGLRERKKAKTRRTIQEHALRLFAAHGYDATTIDQIAEAAEISPSTFFRYFPSKEDVVLEYGYEPVIAEALTGWPAGVAPLQALRSRLREVTTAGSADERRQNHARVKLAFEVPALRAKQMDHTLTTQRMIVETIADRLGLEHHDLRLLTFAAAVLGAWTAAMIVWVDTGPAADLHELVDQALEHLAEGVPLPVAKGSDG